MEFARLAVAALEDARVVLARLPSRAHVEQVDEEVVGELARPIGEDAVPRPAGIGAERPHAAEQHRHLRRRQRQQLRPIDQDALERHLEVLCGEVAEPVHHRLQHGEGLGVRFLRARVRATGRGDASQEQTDAESFEPLEPFADGFRNYLKTKASVKTEDMLVDKAHLLGLSIPEMTALVGGMRALGAVHAHPTHGDKVGVFTDRPGQLTNDFFVNLLDMGTEWEVVDESGDEEFVGRDRKTGEEKYRATRTDLVFGSNSQLRAIAEVFAEKGGDARFYRTFVTAWKKVMDADRFDLSYRKYHG